MKNLLRCLLALSVGVLAADKPRLGHTPEQLRPFLEAKTWTVISLDPMEVIEGRQLPFDDPFGSPPPGSKEVEAAPASPKPKLKPDQIFHDYPILGKHTLPVTPEMRLIIQDLDRAGRLSGGDGMPACYFPRHGIRVVDGGRVYDLQICYQCSIANLYVGNERAGGFHFHDKSPQAPNPNALNAILKKAGVKMSPH
ncbi:MAG: hypothetical protein V4662_03600 [Verrucomicrobiota bacterium]